MNTNTSASVVSLFLTVSEVNYLTGIYKACDGVSKHDRQYAQLKKMGVPFRINARGVPIVTHAAINSTTVIKEEAPFVWKSNKG
jgi:hypothetical protein